MHVSLNFWEMIFVFFLFILLCQKLFSLIKTYAIPFLENQLRALKKEQAELLDKEKLVTTTLNKVDNQRKQQEKMFVLLEKKVQIWHAQLSHHIQQQQRSAREVAEKIAKKRSLQEKNFTSTKTTQQVLPEIIENVRQELMQTYGKDKAALYESLAALNALQKAGSSHG